jgi:hypothetical protein
MNRGKKGKNPTGCWVFDFFAEMVGQSKAEYYQGLPCMVL